MSRNDSLTIFDGLCVSLGFEILYSSKIGHESCMQLGLGSLCPNMIYVSKDETFFHLLYQLPYQPILSVAAMTLWYAGHQEEDVISSTSTLYRLLDNQHCKVRKKISSSYD